MAELVAAEDDPRRGRFSPEQSARVQRWVKNGYIPELERMAKELTAPYWWNAPEATNPDQRKPGGTICFVHTGVRVIGITAGHIHAEIVKRLHSGSSTWCQIGGHTFTPEKHLIDCDETIDLATYRISEIQSNAALANIHYAPAWPPVIEPADVHLVGGWPWVYGADKPMARVHQFLNFFTRLDDAGPRLLQLPVRTSTSVPWGNVALPVDARLGGMSGGPVYRLNERGPVATLTLVGIISDYRKEGEEYVLARPVSVLTPDGEIIR